MRVQREIQRTGSARVHLPLRSGRGDCFPSPFPPRCLPFFPFPFLFVSSPLSLDPSPPSLPQPTSPPFCSPCSALPFLPCLSRRRRVRRAGRPSSFVDEESKVDAHFMFLRPDKTLGATTDRVTIVVAVDALLPSRLRRCGVIKVRSDAKRGSCQVFVAAFFKVSPRLILRQIT